MEEIVPKEEWERIRPRGGVPSGQDGSGEVVVMLASAVLRRGGRGWKRGSNETPHLGPDVLNRTLGADNPAPWPGQIIRLLTELSETPLRADNPALWWGRIIRP